MKFLWSNPKWVRKPTSSGLSRRNLLGMAVAAPFVVQSGVLMPVKKLILPERQLLVPTVRMILEGTENGNDWFPIVQLIGREGSLLDPARYVSMTRYKPTGTRIVIDRTWRPSA